MTNKLDKLIFRLDEHGDQLLTGWVFYGSDYGGYYLINKTFLVIAGIFNGIPKAFRIPGSVAIDTIEDYINYTDSTVRVTTGPRQGILMDISKVQEDEEVIRVGLTKQLRRGRQAHLISDHREGDALFIDCLSKFGEDAHKEEELILPSMYIAVTQNQDKSLRLRRKVNPMEGAPSVLDVVPHKVLHSYDKYYGHGVCVAYGRDNIKARWIPRNALEAASTSSVHIKLMDYMNEFNGSKS
jgi:hypothetical protein